ncbi:MAG: hypothetical protein JNK78_15750 [Planctomycetes bacterium]|nr:hypothetical protein [Planctomycetota bacterium]
MNRILASLSAIGLLGVAAHAQCLDVSNIGTQITTFVTGDPDDGIYTLQPMNLSAAFPITGAATVTGGYTHVFIGSNGWILLTNSAGATAGRPTTTNYGSTTNAASGLRGAAGNQPLLAPYWGDLDNTAGGVFINNTDPNVCKITWQNVNDYTTGTPTPKSFSAEIFATGDVRYSYSAGMNYDLGGTKYVGVSGRNAVALPAVSDLSPGPASSADRLIFQSFATVGTFDLGGKSITFVPTPPAGTGVGWSESVTCQGAYHQNYGVGCYSFVGAPTDAFHEFFATPALASAALQGNAMQLTATGTGYTGTWIPGGASAYVAPGGGALNVFATPQDDNSTTITPSTAFPVPGGSASVLNVMSNGVITPGATAATATDFSPTSAEFGAHTLSAFYAWHDFNENETTPAASGRIKWEEAAGVIYITWDTVENYSSPAATNPSTVQFQLDTATGNVLVVFPVIDTDGTSTFPTGIPYVVGVGGPGAAAPAPVTLATALPITTTPIVTLSPLSLSAAPAPVYSTGNPSVPMTWTINNVIDVAPPFGVSIPVLMFSVGSIPAGIDLGFIDMPGCNLYVPTFDVIIVPSGTAPVSTWGPVQIPQPLSPGLSFYSQAFSLFASNSLPNGQNLAGIISSNGVQSYFNTF